MTPVCSLRGGGRTILPGPEQQPLRIAIIVGEKSGDNLGADLVAALKEQAGSPVELVGVGGPGLREQGLQSLFDPDEIALMGFTAVIARLPRLVGLINSTAKAIVETRPDCLVIIDSPDFTHRVARKVKRALPDLPVINYVCPSVWAWRPGRAKTMRAYVDHILALLPFEPQAVAALDGPPCSYVGHPLSASADAAAARKAQETRRRDKAKPTLLLLPGSRRGEVSRLMQPFAETVGVLAERAMDWRIVIPAVDHVAPLIREGSAGWPIAPEIVAGNEAKWQAFGEADVALAASGTVLLELAMAGVPMISVYKTDVIGRAAMRFITVWSAALPNLIADYPAIPEYYNDLVRPRWLARALERLAGDTPERIAQTAALGHVRAQLATSRPSGELAAKIVLDHIKARDA